MDFDTAFHHLLGHEGSYSNHPSDPGGETMWGITIAVAPVIEPDPVVDPVTDEVAPAE